MAGLPLAAGWAVLGKTPGAAGDYRILRSDRTTFTPREYLAILSRFSPGTPRPPSARPTPDALPWVSTGYAARTGRPGVLGLAVREWTRDLDAAGRPIATTTFACVPFAMLAGHPVTYTDLYRAIRAADIPSRPDGATLELRLPPLDPEALEAEIDRAGLDLVVDTTALLLKSPVAVLGAPPVTTEQHVSQRLAFLDAVTSLLPYGQRARLTVSTWAQADAEHRIRLAVTARTRPGDEAVRWGESREWGEVREPTERYRALLWELVDGPAETAALIDHLAFHGRPHGVDLKHALSVLAPIHREAELGPLAISRPPESSGGSLGDLRALLAGPPGAPEAVEYALGALRATAPAAAELRPELWNALVWLCRYGPELGAASFRRWIDVLSRWIPLTAPDHRNGRMVGMLTVLLYLDGGRPPTPLGRLLAKDGRSEISTGVVEGYAAVCQAAESAEWPNRIIQALSDQLRDAGHPPTRIALMEASSMVGILTAVEAPSGVDVPTLARILTTLDAGRV
ncbi:hypothetical protein [Cryptosporangium sp. NPDC051539]|uniref:hypothetical protein n=1 Tax=Cryptosporangium sp. NPDC051539 TaxID=3363962 RepID=UPI00378C7587